MKAQRIILSILFFVIATGIPIVAYGLTVTAKVTINGVMTDFGTLGSSTTRVDVGGVLTTTVTLSSVPVAAPPGSFTITGSVKAEQSGSIDKVTFQNMSITSTGCSTTTPCLLQITATSDSGDFDPLTPGTYQYSVVLDASVDGVAGDEITVTGVANNDTINLVPDGPPVSLPWACTGLGSTDSPPCNQSSRFITVGIPALDNFQGSGSEPIPLLACGSPLCTPSLSSTLNINFVGTSVKISAAGAAGSTRGPTAGSAGPLIGTTIPPLIGTSLKPFSTKVDIIQLSSGLSDFDFKNDFNVLGDGIISPLSQDVSFSVGTFSTTIPAGSFTQNPQGFVFQGTINNVALQAKVVPLGGTPPQWELKVDASGANLTGTRNPVPMGLKIGDKSGATWVSADFMSGP